MAYTTSLRGYTLKRLEEIGQADIIVGIPCFNNDKTIAHVIQMVSHGLDKFYRNSRNLIFIADGGSTDDTREEAKEFQIGGYVFNYPLRTLVYKDGEYEEKLSPKEAHLLKMFCLSKNDVLERSEALKKIWGEDNYFTARSMDVFVTKLRKYLSKDESIEIANIHGNGFRLIEKNTI